MKRLEEICIFIRNGLNIKNEKSKKGIPVTRIETISNGIIDINKTGYANIFDDKYIDYYLRQDDILMSHINSLKHLGKVGYCYYDMKIIHGMNLLNIRVNPNNVYPKYLYYYFKSNNFKIKLNKISKQSVNQSSFSISDLKKIRIDIIDLKKQKLIASKLDKVVEVISIRKKQIEELNNLIKSQFVEMFENNKFENKDLGDVAIKITDGSHNPPKGVDERTEYVMLSSQNIIEDKINYNNARYLSRKDFERENKRTYLEKGDVLLTIVGTIGRTAVIDNEKNITLQRSVAVIKPIEKIKSEYLVASLKTDSAKNQLNKRSKGVAQKGIYLNDLKKIFISVPPITLQNEFSEIVKQIDKQKFEIEKSLKETQELYESLMEKYFG